MHTGRAMKGPWLPFSRALFQLPFDVHLSTVRRLIRNSIPFQSTKISLYAKPLKNHLIVFKNVVYLRLSRFEPLFFRPLDINI